MKVKPNIESEKKYTSDYFKESKFVKGVYKFEYSINRGIKAHIAFNIDSNFCRQLGVAITSIMENNEDIDVCFYVFIDDINEYNKNNFDALAKKYKHNIYIYIMNEHEFSGFHIRNKRFKYVTYFRLYMNKILKQFTNKFIYLDADTICLRSIKPFLEIDLEGKTIAAVHDLPDAVRERSTFLGLEYGNYLDSGVMIIDCEAWEKRHVTERCFAYSGLSPKLFTAHDQDVLNLVLDGDVKFISKIFNFLGVYGFIIPNECIIYHFFGRDKPWDLALREIDKKWRQYLSISPWDDINGDLPAKKSEKYYCYKRAATYYKNNNETFKCLSAFFWYSILKIMKYLNL